MRPTARSASPSASTSRPERGLASGRARWCARASRLPSEQLTTEARALAGSRVGLFSYGSGCCGEFFSGVVGAGAARRGALTDVEACWLRASASPWRSTSGCSRCPPACPHPPHPCRAPSAWRTSATSAASTRRAESRTSAVSACSAHETGSAKARASTCLSIWNGEDDDIAIRVLEPDLPVLRGWVDVRLFEDPSVQTSGAVHGSIEVIDFEP